MFARPGLKLVRQVAACSSRHSRSQPKTAIPWPPSPFQSSFRTSTIRSFGIYTRRLDDQATSRASSHAQQSISTPDIELLKALPPEKPDQPSYALVFTCKKCTHRSAHRISKQGYNKGTVLIQCPSCKNRHLIADHLKIFNDNSVTLEQILAEKGDLVQKGGFSVEGDLELWDHTDQEVKQVG